MKSTDILAVFTATLTLAEAAHSHGHRHFHDKKRAVEVVTVPGPTVVTYEFEGKALSKDQVCKGVAAGEYVWGAGNDHSADCAAPAPAAPAPAAPAPAPAEPASPADTNKVKIGAQNLEKPSSSYEAPKESPKESPKDSPKESTSDETDVSTPNLGKLTGYDVKIASNPNTGKKFPNGKLPCSTFPEAYGAIPIDWMGIGGWSGIQYTPISNGYAGRPETAVKGEGCEERPGRTTFCSYSCPPGWQKSQWPKEQGPPSDPVSIGGIKCENGKLWLTQPDTETLCIQGTGEVKVKNMLKKNAAICRTDYPGTENEVVPLNTQPGEEYDLTCPDSGKYYQHLKDNTTAQYYVNMEGISVDQACQWSYDGSHMGNFAPNYFGVGRNPDWGTFLSIATTSQNNPTDYKALNYNVELVGNFGKGNACFYVYKNGIGHYCTKGSLKDYNLNDCDTEEKAKKATPPRVPGCTVHLQPGTEATYVLTDA